MKVGAGIGRRIILIVCLAKISTSRAQSPGASPESFFGSTHFPAGLSESEEENVSWFPYSSGPVYPHDGCDSTTLQKSPSGPGSQDSKQQKWHWQHRPTAWGRPSLSVAVCSSLQCVTRSPRQPGWVDQSTHKYQLSPGQWGGALEQRKKAKERALLDHSYQWHEGPVKVITAGPAVGGEPREHDTCNGGLPCSSVKTKPPLLQLEGKPWSIRQITC